MKNLILLSLVIIVINASNKFYVDNEGLIRDNNHRIMTFHGFNTVYKPAPYIPVTDHFDPKTSLSSQDFQLLSSLGFNVIRLHVAFQAAMPTRGVIQDNYLLSIREIVRNANKYGIYVILDAHQDLLNRQFCGEGFPDWAVTKSNFPHPQEIELRYDEQGYPLIEDCLQQNFAKFYLTEDVGRNYESILKNENGVADMFGLFWQRVAQLFKDEPNVLGYEILNEPVAANWQRSKIDFLWPGWGNKHLIMGFYKIINEYIRAVDQDTLVFFEPYFTDVFGGGFKENIGGEEYKSKEVFSYHVYCGIVDPQGTPKSNMFCNLIHQIFFSRKKTNWQHLGTGAFLSEFGATANNKKSQKMLNKIMKHADNLQHSWTYWQFKSYDDYTTASEEDAEGFFLEDGSLQMYKAKALVRPYTYASCSNRILKQSFEYKKQKYLLVFKASENCKSEVFIPYKIQFEKGFEYKFEGCNECYLVEGDKRGYYMIDGQFKENQKITLKVRGTVE